MRRRVRGGVPERDVRFTKGPVDDLEHASQLPACGSKMGIELID